jgi:ubiquinone/menaquinone biosynthesis C-methylase UbiE
MGRHRLDYDSLAADYNSRYSNDSLQGIAQALLGLAGRFSAATVLEAGCGTGRWIGTLRPLCSRVFGADSSMGMLLQARARLGSAGLIRAVANELPFADRCFDFIYCVNALHHFDDGAAFVRKAAGMLEAGGVLALVGIDPRKNCHRYHYDYFPGARDMDLVRYPSFDEQMDWAQHAGLTDIDLRIVDEYMATYSGREVLADPFLVKNSNSMLALLTDQAYNAGLSRIRAAVEHSEASGEPIEFRTRLGFGMVSGCRASDR